MHRNVDHGAVPDGRTVIEFRFPDAPTKARSWWLVISEAGADVCDADPGYDVSVTVTAALRSMVKIWNGDLTSADAFRRDLVEVHGPTELRRAVPRWFTLSTFAAVPRPATA
ncbi:hypothetical protein GCM10011608_30680 [Micromonospora sonchi]|uniref:SCP2 domain-containing protein n=1 Tax=Micromonospora sonchi TaxID=1763543 RepID=A0A917TXZ4_9ACTN|nr:SCP2 sterol-binding domain-containing protein [Micromonospora sonchi]GGM43769.1 hypothetical protein GCM10011608_30680 [Micromonospora sonchi]